jgi:hypothetical protein
MVVLNGLVPAGDGLISLLDVDSTYTTTAHPYERLLEISAEYLALLLI